jgi:hypothetical protein
MDASNTTVPQTISFSKADIAITVTPGSTPTSTISGSALAANISDQAPSFSINGKSATISAIDVAGATSGTYQLTQDQNTLNRLILTKVGNLDNSASASLPSIIDANTSQTLNFSGLGIQLQITANANYSSGSNQT